MSHWGLRVQAREFLRQAHIYDHQRCGCVSVNGNFKVSHFMTTRNRDNLVIRQAIERYQEIAPLESAW